MSYFVFGDFDTRECGIYVYGCSPFNSAEKDVEYISIMGRNGDIINENNRFHNVPIAYHCIVTNGLESKLDEVKVKLNLASGYQILRDGFNEGVFRKAAFSSTIEPTTKPHNDAGKFDIVFNCMPQRFLDEGEDQVSYSAVSSGGFDESGDNTDAYMTYRVEYMPVEPDMTFNVRARYVSTSFSAEVLTVAWYDENKVFISSIASEGGLDQKIRMIVPANARYARIMFGAGTTFWKGAEGVKVTYGKSVVHYGDGGILLVNPTGFDAKPIFRLIGAESQTLTVRRLGTEDSNIVNDETKVAIADYSSTNRSDIVIDSVVGNSYSEYIAGFFFPYDLNAFVTITDANDVFADYPHLGRGRNLITTTGFDSLTVQAGWWKP